MRKKMHLGKLVIYLGVLIILQLPVLLIVVDAGKGGGCFEEERMALLELKSSLLSMGVVDPRIYTWVSDDHLIIPSTTTCCEWEMVTCNHTTGHVTELSLSSMFEHNNPPPPAGRDLNISLFLPFKDLQSLNLSHNSFTGWIQDEELSNLKNLEKLDLSYTYLPHITTKHDCASFSRLKKLGTLSLSGTTCNKTIIPCLSALPSLKNLYFAGNDLQGAFIPQEILVLDKLETLDLSSNWLSSSPTKKDCKSLSKLKKLENLYLKDNGFNKTIILLCLSALPSLKNLYLDGNQLGMARGSIPAQELSVLDKLETLDLSANSLNGSLTKKDCQSLSKLRSLRHLDLSGNNFDKDILRCLGNLSSLKYLTLTLNNASSPLSNQEITHLSNLEVLILEACSGTLPMEGLASFRNLEILDLTGNSFVGSISSSISALSSLKALSLAGNELGGSLPTQGFCELKELEELDLSGNMFVGTLPPCLSNLTSLRCLDLSQNQFSGRVPPSLITDFTALEFIDLSYNNLEGVFSFISSSAKIRILNLAHNMMEGSFSNSSLQIFTKLEHLNLRNNSFSGTFHLPPDRQSNLYFIDISDNNFTGRMQANIGQILPVVSYLNFSSNYFEGDINHLIGGGEMSNLQLLDLSVNKFSGQILSSNLSSLRQLKLLVISNNSFSGTIPTSIYNMTALVALSMQNNFFRGNFPTDLLRVNEIQYLDVSHNSLSGSLSSFSSLGNLQHLHLQTNRFTGPIPHSFNQLSDLVTLDISDNNLSGHLPSFIGEFPKLRVISVRGNDFSGFIPNKLCQLTTLSLMDLSNNSFSGSLPHCFHNITFFAKTEASVPDEVFPGIFFPFILFGIQNSYTNIILGNTKSYFYEYIELNIQDEVEFGTKHSRNTYVGGRILNYMSGLDLSSNNLTGEIPPEFGMLKEIHALNLSHNKLTGPIPKAFWNLTQIESLDLSFNRLSGQIPSQLIDLNFLAVFSVAHNNLSGRLPERKKQFATFEGDSYEGNQFQCGLPVVEENCKTGGFNNSTPSPQEESEEEDKWYEVDRVFFTASFIAAYTVFLFGYGALLYINPNWRRRWFNLIEECMYSCYYFLYDSLHKLSALVRA